jgi:hypothetical protein
LSKCHSFFIWWRGFPAGKVIARRLPQKGIIVYGIMFIRIFHAHISTTHVPYVSAYVADAAQTALIVVGLLADPRLFLPKAID